MTTMNKPVTRRTLYPYRVLYQEERPIVVTLATTGGHDVIVFREHGRRGRWMLPVATAFRSAVRLQAFLDSARRKGKAP
jgi:hypothetical protein